MTIRTILTVAGVGNERGDLELAARLCQQTGAHLSVLVVGMAAPPPIGEYAAVVSDAWLQERQAEMHRVSDRVSEVTSFIAASAVSGDVADEYVELAWADESVGRRARYADLTLAGPNTLLSGTLKDKVIEGALFGSGKPLLLIPAGIEPTLSPKRVLIGWDGRIEASRAVREALDMLRGAQEVRVALVDPGQGEDTHGEEPGADLAAYLARHGVKVTVDRLPREGNSVADVLRRHATDTAAEMIVMGAYGHSRLRERIFGGVTRSMIENPTLPIFMAR
ncbi:universal stress protein [Pseudaminobacter sp. 19-2017]|uniref:Universal stress protein n=1 Tax=Pseudaminobacter soli (ex Zhang et al. 2022) TaxID=2831468 RepID=A0A942E7P1_9HYPH|nr:universal stress protein [Pseudaminobacter soli]MBS3649947.1 universal stress protein [Pseudaminobacter soli]